MEPTVQVYADEQPEQRAALVAGLRQLADWFEHHNEVPVPTYPDFSFSARQSGMEWARDDAEGMARLDVIAVALGASLEHGRHVHAERMFAGLRVRASFIPQAARENDAPADVPALSKIWACPEGCGYLIADGPVEDGDEPTDELIRQHMEEHEPMAEAASTMDAEVVACKRCKANLISTGHGRWVAGRGQLTCPGHAYAHQPGCRFCGKSLERLPTGWVDLDGWFRCAKDRDHEPIVPAEAASTVDDRGVPQSGVSHAGDPSAVAG